MNSYPYCPRCLFDLDENSGRDLHVITLSIYGFHENWRRGGCTFLTGLRVFHETIRYSENKEHLGDVHVPRYGLRRLQSFHFLIYRYPSTRACFPCSIPQNRGHYKLIGLFTVFLEKFSFEVSSTFQITTRKYLPGKGLPSRTLHGFILLLYICSYPAQKHWFMLLILLLHIYCLFRVYCLFQAAMTTSVDRDKIKEAYEDVRSDSTETEW
jgi:hypothetical protein